MEGKGERFVMEGEGLWDSKQCSGSDGGPATGSGLCAAETGGDNTPCVAVAAPAADAGRTGLQYPREEEDRKQDHCDDPCDVEVGHE